MPEVIVCAEQRSWRQAGQFAAKALGDVELRSFEDVRHRRPVGTILVYLTDPNYQNVRSLLTGLKPGSPNVVIYYASRPALDDAVQLGKLVGELRPRHTSVFFEAKAAVASALSHSPVSKPAKSALPATGPRLLRERFGLTQTEMAHSLDVSLRTIQNWERNPNSPKRRRLQDLDELWHTLQDSIKKESIASWLHSENETFGGKSPIDLVGDGRARDVIVEFQRLQSGEPI